MTILLTQQEADALLVLEKHFLADERFEFPALGGALRIPLHSSDRREEFNLDITRGRILLEKNTFQTRTPESRLYAFLNDSTAAVSPSVVDALKNYNLEPVLWSERENAREALVA